MTAGSGIIHQEMPRGDERGRMGGFQLWANLPAAHKMMRPALPGRRGGRDPARSRDGGATIRVIAGTVGDVAGPVSDITVDPEYLDVTLAPERASWTHPVPADHTVFAYLFEGDGRFGADRRHLIGADRHARAVRGRRRRDRRRPGRERRPLPARLGQAAARAGRLARPDRDEHPGGTRRPPGASSTTGRSSSIPRPGGERRSLEQRTSPRYLSVTTRGFMKCGQVIRPAGLRPPPERPKPPNGCRPTAAPVIARLR